MAGAQVFCKSRFKEVICGYLVKQFTIFGQHIHVGCASCDDALHLLHALSRYIPHFIALAASSPFVQCKDRLFNSAFAFPPSGRQTARPGLASRRVRSASVRRLRSV